MNRTVKSKPATLLRWTATALLGCLGLSLGSACSSPAMDCTPPIPPGARYRVTVVDETPESKASNCHVVTLQSPFEITAATEDASGAPPQCAMTPAKWAPAEAKGINVIRCKPVSSYMLGTECEMSYPSTCPGKVHFYFHAPPEAGVNWAAPIITGARFRIHDQILGCIPNESGCLNEYIVNLERLPDVPAAG